MTSAFLENFDMAVRAVLLFVQMSLALFLFIRSFRYADTNERKMPMVLFAFGLACFFLGDIYWFAHTLIRPGVRLPFNVSDMGDNGIFLFFAAALVAAFPGQRCGNKVLYACTTLFTAANIALWISWSGEWVKDIVGGATFGWFLCAVARSLWLSGSLSRREWGWLGGACAVLIAGQAAIFFVPETLKKPLDGFCYVLLFSGILLWLVKTIRAMKKARWDVFLSIAFACEAWILFTMYMSADPIYYAADLACTLMFPVMFLAVRRAVTEA